MSGVGVMRKLQPFSMDGNEYLINLCLRGVVDILSNCAAGRCTISQVSTDNFKSSLPTVEEIEAGSNGKDNRND
jgi:hypothetical protein